MDIGDYGFDWYICIIFFYIFIIYKDSVRECNINVLIKVMVFSIYLDILDLFFYLFLDICRVSLFGYIELEDLIFVW